MRLFIVIVCMIYLQGPALGQSVETDTVPDNLLLPADSSRVDTISDLQKTSSKYSQPKRATLYSLVIPGAGQVYNGQWWKVPIIYGTGYLLYSAIKTNTENYKIFREAYILRVDDDPNTVDEYEGILSEAGLKSRRDFYNKNRQLSIIGISFLYLLNGLDAFISAHLRSFDISDDLSLDYRSIQITELPINTPGLALTWRFSNPKNLPPPTTLP